MNLLLNLLWLVFATLTNCLLADLPGKQQAASGSLSLLAKADVGDNDLDLDDSVYASADTGGSTWMAQIQSKLKQKKDEAARKEAEKLKRQREEIAAQERAKAQLAVLYRQEQMREKNRGLAARGRALMHGYLPQVDLQTDEARSGIMRREPRDEPLTQAMKDSMQEAEEERDQWWGQHGVTPKFQPSIEERLRKEEMKALKQLQDNSDDSKPQGFNLPRSSGYDLGGEKQMLFSTSEQMASPDQHEDNIYEDARPLVTDFAAAHDSDRGMIRADLVDAHENNYNENGVHEEGSLDDTTDKNGVYGGPPPGTPDQNDDSQQPVVDGSGLFASSDDKNVESFKTDDGQGLVTDGSGLYGGSADSEAQDAAGGDNAASDAQPDVPAEGTVESDETNGDVRTITVDMRPPGNAGGDSGADAPDNSNDAAGPDDGDSPPMDSLAMLSMILHMLHLCTGERKL
jgi:hypothetical protein